MDGVSKHLDEVKAVGTKAGEAIEKGFAPVVAVGQKVSGLFGGVIGTVFNKIASIGQTAFKLLTASVIGFTTAGIALSGMGTLLAYRLERLSLVMAGLFRPEIQKVIEYLTRFTTWLSSSGNFVRKFLDALAPIERVFFRIVDAMGPLFHAFDRLMGAIGDLATDIATLLAFAFETGLIPQIEAAVYWMTLLVEQITNAIKMLEILWGLKGIRELAGPAPSRSPFAARAGGVEQLGAAYNRIAQISLLATGGRSIEKESLDTLKKIERNTARNSSGGQAQRADAPTFTEGLYMGAKRAIIPSPVIHPALTPH